MARKPFISILIPTRNRPELIAYALRSLRQQSFTDFEVIVSDNHTGIPCKHVFDRYADDRFRYISPASPLPMHDNWEFAADVAVGEYVGVLIDKTVFRPSALEILHNALATHPAEIVSGWNEAYVLANEASGYGKGVYTPLFQNRPVTYYDPKEELQRRFRMEVRRGFDGINYFWGKINFGVYSRQLIERIKKRVGRLFYPMCPDYTSTVSALALTNSAVDVGQPLRISIQSKVSNGFQVSQQANRALDFLKEIDPTGNIIEQLPVRGLYTCVHNGVASDYMTMKQRLGDTMCDVELNMANLLVRVREDLDNVIQWSDPAVKRDQYGIWRSYFKSLPRSDRLAIRRKWAGESFTVKRERLMQRLSLATQRSLYLARRSVPESIKGMIRTKRPLPVEQPSASRLSFECEDMVEAAQCGDKYYRGD